VLDPDALAILERWKHSSCQWKLDEGPDQLTWRALGPRKGMLNRPAPGGLLELRLVAAEELRCVGVHRSESVKVHVRGLEKGPDHTEEVGDRQCRAPLMMIKIRHLPMFCDLRVENWGSEFKLRRLC
jgi:hypothetical protein